MAYTYKPAKILPFQGLHGCDSKFGVHAIRLPDGRVAVIATELPDNTGTSITNFAEVIVVKQRQGPPGTVRLHFDGPTMRFNNLQYAPQTAGGLYQ